MTDQSNEEIVARFVSDHRPEAVGEDIFVAATGEGTVRTYGGAILSRAAAVASLTVEGKRLHSLHTYFLTAGDMAAPVRFAVTRVRDGRGYANRRIQATQDDRVLCDVIANFAAQDDGDAHVAPRPPETPPPEAARDGWELLQRT